MTDNVSEAETAADPPTPLRVCSTHSSTSLDVSLSGNELSVRRASVELASSLPSPTAWDHDASRRFNRSSSITSQTSQHTLSSDEKEDKCRLCLVRTLAHITVRDGRGVIVMRRECKTWHTQHELGSTSACLERCRAGGGGDVDGCASVRAHAVFRVPPGEL
jgi:hypothetical protein